MKFTINIEPKAQMRARHAMRGRFATVYKDRKQAEAEQTINAFLAMHQPPEPMQGPLCLGIKAYMPIPKSFSKKKLAAALSGELRPTTKPDLDNLIKNAKDCLTQMRYWEDDKQVVEYLPGTGKYYSDKPRWELEIVPYGG